MNETIGRARRSLERELRHTEAHAEKLRKALAAMQAIDGHGTGKRARRGGVWLTCKYPGCGTKFQALRRDAMYCRACKPKYKRDIEAQRRGKPNKKGVVLARNTPTASAKK